MGHVTRRAGHGDILVASQKEKRMIDKEKKSKTMQQKSSTRKHVEYGEQENNEKEPKNWRTQKLDKNRNKDLIQMRRTQARSIPPLPLETTSSSMVMDESDLKP
jgi:hypothetical protein